MSSIKSETEEFELKRPRRSCVLNERKPKEKSEDSSEESSSSSSEEEDDLKDLDFSLNMPRKKHKKSKKSRKKKEKKIVREAPSFYQVMNAHRSHEKKLNEKRFIEYYNSDDEDDDNIFGIRDEEEQMMKEQRLKEEAEKDIKELEPKPEQTKKKRIVIRPWVPGWYQVPH